MIVNITEGVRGHEISSIFDEGWVSDHETQRGPGKDRPAILQFV